MLRERLPRTPGVPVVALTATAPTAVRDDIVEQLGIGEGCASCTACRRDNLAISLFDAPPGARTELAVALLSEPGRLPAIVYAPPVVQPTGWRARCLVACAPPPITRPRAGRTRAHAARLSPRRAAGGGGNARLRHGRRQAERAQRAAPRRARERRGLLSGNRTRGTRWSASLAALLWSERDLRTHAFFFARDFPETRELERVYGALTEAPLPVAVLAETLALEPAQLDAALDKLWLHGGALRDSDQRFSPRQRRVSPHLPHPPCAARGAARSHGALSRCRWLSMLALVGHFGDRADHGAPCGHCDRCQPQQRAAGFTTPHASRPRARKRASSGTRSPRKRGARTRTRD